MIISNVIYDEVKKWLADKYGQKLTLRISDSGYQMAWVEIAGKVYQPGDSSLAVMCFDEPAFQIVMHYTGFISDSYRFDLLDPTSIDKLYEELAWVIDRKLDPKLYR